MKSGRTCEPSGTPLPVASDLTYVLDFEGERLPIEEHYTLGRHLENDLVVAGDDVEDYHLRLEVTERGPSAYPLGVATYNLNGVELDQPMGLVVGDRLTIGSSDMQLTVERVEPSGVEEWWFYEEYGGASLPLQDTMVVGRNEDCDLTLADDHISRRHAKIVLAEDAVWVQDLHSANGTKVNGHRLAGGCRVLHGDLVHFDELGFQLVAKGGDMTAARRPKIDDLRPLEEENAEAPELADQTQVLATDTTQATAVLPLSPAPAMDASELPPNGLYLIGETAPVEARVIPLDSGRMLIGRTARADVQIKHSTVSAEHAEIVVRTEGVVVRNLMATNGTFVNERPADLVELQDGDRLRVGEVVLVFRKTQRQARRPIRWWLAAGAGLLLAVALAAWMMA